MKRPSRLLGALTMVLVAGISAAACGSSNDTGNCTEGSDTREHFLCAYENAFCDGYKPCCDKLGVTSDGTTCRAFFTIASTQGDTSTYDPAKGQACLDAIRAAVSSPTFCDEGTNAADSACSDVLGNGATKKAGDACESGSECQKPAGGDATCTSFGQGGICQSIIPGKAGDTPCVAQVEGTATSYLSSGKDAPAQGYSCDRKDDLVCDQQSKACKALAKAGESCSFTGDCTATTYCASGTCAARLGADAACDPNNDPCGAGFYCDATAKACKATLAEGAACQGGSQCTSKSCVNGVCAKGSSDFGQAFAAALLCGGN